MSLKTFDLDFAVLGGDVYRAKLYHAAFDDEVGDFVLNLFLEDAADIAGAVFFVISHVGDGKLGGAVIGEHDELFGERRDHFAEHDMRDVGIVLLGERVEDDDFVDPRDEFGS